MSNQKPDPKAKLKTALRQNLRKRKALPDTDSDVAANSTSEFKRRLTTVNKITGPKIKK